MITSINGLKPLSENSTTNTVSHQVQQLNHSESLAQRSFSQQLNETTATEKDRLLIAGRGDVVEKIIEAIIGKGKKNNSDSSTDKKDPASNSQKSEDTAPSNTKKTEQDKSKSWSIPKEVEEKIPDGWDRSETRKGVGTKWQDPNDNGNGVRIDKGNPNNSQTTQQTDHVIVRSEGKVIGRDGKPINGSIKDNYDKAHIPLSEYKDWIQWNSPK